MNEISHFSQVFAALGGLITFYAIFGRHLGCWQDAMKLELDSGFFDPEVSALRTIGRRWGLHLPVGPG